MSPFEQLGLPPDADERMIKRAYAQRLRDTRPDSDPEGFQRLHAIYQAALAQCEGKPLAETVRHAPSHEATTPTGSTAAPTPDPPRKPPVFSFERFHAELSDLAARGDAVKLSAWLEQQPALWSLQLKTRAGHELFARLHRETPPMSPACMDVLLAFFDMNQARPGNHALLMQQLQRRMQLAWELQPSQRDKLAERMDMRLHSERRELDHKLDRLAQPPRWDQIFRIGITPYAVSSYVQFIQRLGLGHPEDLPEACNREQIHFWQKATEHGQVGRQRLQLGAIRCFAALLGGLLWGLLLGIAMHIPPARFYWPVFWFCLGIPIAVCSFWALCMLVLPLDGWHAKPEYQPARWPWLNLLLVPVLCTATLAFAISDNYTAALLPALAGLWLALRRLWRRNVVSLRLSPRLIWVGLWGVFMLTRSLLNGSNPNIDDTTYPALAATTAMLAWSVDLWRQRQGLRVRRRISR
ncbi:MAG: hypothetical protein RSP_21580 [Rhodanobacter sp.]